MPYQWLTYVQARQALAQRLADPGNQFWTDAENALYILEALRTWSAFTEQWNTDFAFTVTNAQTWWSLASQSGSPRLRTLADADLYTIMQYHLLEQPTGGGTWTGTSQFSLPMLQAALQRRADEVIQVSGSNLSPLVPISVPAGSYRMGLPDNVLEPRRVRWLPAVGNNVTLAREDVESWDHFAPDHLQSSANPTSWGVISGPPLSIDLDNNPNQPGALDVMALISGVTFAPPVKSLLSVPDDWAWVLKWGALADLLAQESETTDLPRAKFCQQRYVDGLKAMVESNWLLEARINGVPVDTPSLAELDQFAPEWADNPNAWPCVVQAGMDLVAPCPVVAGPTGVFLTLVGSAPIPILDGDFVQVSRDTFDAILSYAQMLAQFKQGGSEFSSSTGLMEEFALAVQATNTRLAQMGLFSDVLRTEGKRQEVTQPR